MTSESTSSAAPNLAPLPAPPSTDEMLTYLATVGPVLQDIAAHQDKANQFAARLHERGIDYRTGLPVAAYTVGDGDSITTDHTED